MGGDLGWRRLVARAVDPGLSPAALAGIGPTPRTIRDLCYEGDGHDTSRASHPERAADAAPGQN